MRRILEEALALCFLGCAPACAPAAIPVASPPADAPEQEILAHPSPRDVSNELEQALHEVEIGNVRAAASDLFAIVCPGKATIFTAAGFAQCPKARSSDIGTAWVALGTLAFESRIDRSALGAGVGTIEDAAMAEVAFKRALTVTNRTDPGVIRYKIAWAQYRQDRFSDALSGFLEVLASGKHDLHDEAIEYAAICINETGGRIPKDAPYAGEIRARLDAMTEP